MAKIWDQFVSREEAVFKFRVGRTLASALSGFLAGFFLSSIIFSTVLYWVILK